MKKERNEIERSIENFRQNMRQLELYNNDKFAEEWMKIYTAWMETI